MTECAALPLIPIGTGMAVLPLVFLPLLLLLLLLPFILLGL